MPETRAHETPSGGLHLVFKHMPGLRCSVSRLGLGIDVRADGGYVIWWPAAGYPVLCEAPIADWPFPGLVRAPSGAFRPVETRCLPVLDAPSGARMQPTRDLRKRTKHILRLVELAQPSTRNDRLFWAACRFGEMLNEGVIGRQVAEQLLTSAARLCRLQEDDGPEQVRATIASGLKTGTTPYTAMPAKGSR
jgi:hypothetical protein